MTASKIDFKNREERIREKTCSCGEVFQAREFYISGLLVVNEAYCPGCVDQIRATREEKERRSGNERQRMFVPPLYADTDLSRLSIPPYIIQKVLAWEPGPRGISLSGPSGTGKTRLILVLLTRLQKDGCHPVFATAKQFERWVHKMFEKDDDAKKHIESCRRARVLFIDDIGKEKYTARVESEFYDLIEHRTSHLLPILWTSNATGQQLEEMMGEDRGSPIVRRLREFTEIISV